MNESEQRRTTRARIVGAAARLLRERGEERLRRRAAGPEETE
ncbi:hypothetical protein ACWEGQ_38985 [Streptomyces seoulensis]